MERHQHRLGGVGDSEGDRAIGAALQGSIGDEPAEPESRSLGNGFLRNLRRRIEEDDLVLERDEDKPDGERKHGSGHADDDEAAALACHCVVVSPAAASSAASASASAFSAGLRAAATADFAAAPASTGRPSTA